MAKNGNLHAAKTAKNDEFYTRYEDVNSEINTLEHGYRPHFENKVVYCNCDDPEWSNFWKYFKDRFSFLKLKGLIATHYEKGENKSSYALFYNGSSVKKTELEGNGDFLSNECIDLLKQADIVVTNPPFSLFREYVAQLIEYKKKFIIIGNKNAITYKEFFPLLKENKVWIGYNQPKDFTGPDGQKTEHTTNGLCRWFTNLDIPKRHYEMKLGQRYEGHEDFYPHYDNYDAINVDKVADIPCDYCESWGIPASEFEKISPTDWKAVRRDNEGYVWIIPAAGTELRKLLSEHTEGYKEAIEESLNDALYCSGQMGVPITYLDSHNPDQMNIVRFRKGDDGKDLAYSSAGKVVYGAVEKERERERERVQPYFRIVIRRKL